DELEIKDLQEASKETIGEELEISEEKFESSIDLENCVRKRDLTGGPAPTSVEEQLEKIRKKIDEKEDVLTDDKAQIEDFKQGLEKTIED
ncbi:MAG: hypothetical protein ABEJ72_00625, partial [Candidatus Aenigmatarchaeota archaeon]